jgi:hypothetical protein
MPFSSTRTTAIMHRRISLALYLGFLALPAFADSSLPNITVGAEGYIENYKETVDGSTFMKEDSLMVALVASARLDLTNTQALEFSGRYGRGYADYSSDSGHKDGLTRISSDWRLVYKHDFAAGTSTVTPEAGFGVRLLTDHLDEFQPGGYRRESTYQYLLLGVSNRSPLADNWALVPRFAYQYLVRGTQKSHLCDINPTYPDLSNTQRNGYGLELSVGFEKKLADSNIVALTPFFRYWHIGDSSTDKVSNTYVTITGKEPKNTTEEAGFNVAYRF